ncbi:COBW domain-containing protein 1 [Porphyridium purpureum]|uniref:COBW domain-containing protein 1 n=1 Tax=Porphyridium purpureum TaxID=35688 RepID=A0A5J4YPP6_PORPP|nr:COBW domain-containing protein 1 [Porphyridium purpureum]|eukprot:POR8324..scf222_8
MVAIPVTLLTGFLGSGKTTLLNALLRQSHHGLRIAVVVNEFGAVDIDSQLIANESGSGANPEVVSLKNGCMCCTVSNSVAETLLSLLNVNDGLTERLDHVVIETSGISDPAGMVHMLDVEELRRYVFLDQILTVVDAANVMSAEEYKSETASSQIKLADTIYLSKSDLLFEDQFEKIRKFVQGLTSAEILYTKPGHELPVLALFGCSFSALPDVSSPRTSSRRQGQARTDGEKHVSSQHLEADGFETLSLISDRELDMARFRNAFVQARLPGVYRAKGILFFSGYPLFRFVFQLSERRHTVEHSTQQVANRTSQLVLIGRGIAKDEDMYRAMFDSCVVDSGDSTKQSASATVVEWDGL